VGDFVKLAKSKPGAIDYASAGLGTATFLAAEIFKAEAGVDLTHVPYKGGGESLRSIISGETAVYFSPLLVALSHMNQGRLRAVAVTSKKRVPQVSQVPTVAESGYPKYEFNFWNGLLVPAKTQKEIIAAIHSAAVTALKTPQITKRLSEMASSPVCSQPAEFGAFVQSEVSSIAQVARKLNLTAEPLR
jgi:tripartite-type tricarboxylate transporter receptor subunit TctC